MEVNKGNSKKIIKYCIGKRFIPVKVSQMYEIFHAYTNADAIGKLSMTWKASGQPQILSNTSLESVLNVHKRDTGHVKSRTYQVRGTERFIYFVDQLSLEEISPKLY